MDRLPLAPFHSRHGARFLDLNGKEAASDYGDWRAEHKALREGAGLIDMSFRSRLCIVGADAQKFLNGQVTNNVKDLKVGQGCYAALVSAKGKMQSDLNIYRLENELLLDFEPGMTEAVKQRLEKFVIAEDAQLIDVGPLYGLLRVQGPKAATIIAELPWLTTAPHEPMGIAAIQVDAFGELYLAFHPGPPSPAFSFFAPVEFLERLAEALVDPVGRLCGWQALETARVEATVPRFGIDMDETNLPPEAGLDACAISYSKGCYIGQEVIARIRTYGQVAKTLRGIKISTNDEQLPARGAKLSFNDKEVGCVTGAVASPHCQSNIALAYVRREANAVGTELLVEIDGRKIPAKVQTSPFEPF